MPELARLRFALGLVPLLLLFFGAQAAEAAWIMEGSGRRLSSFPHTENFDTSSQYDSEIVFVDDLTAVWSHSATGGWQGTGCAQFNFLAGDNEHGTGIGDIHFPHGVGERPSVINIRWLVYYGPDYHAAQNVEGAKTLIVQRCNANCDNWGESSERAMVIQYRRNGRRFDSICENVACGPENDPTGLETGKTTFYIEEHLGEWISMEAEFDMITGVYKLYIDTVDGTQNSVGGTSPYQMRSVVDANPAELYQLQLLSGYWESRLLGDWNFDDAFYRLDELAIDTTYIGPPDGFRADPGDTTPPAAPQSLQVL